MKYESTASYSKSKFSLVKIKNKIYIKKKPNKIDEREFQSIQKQNNFIPFKVNNYDVIAAKIISKKKFIKINKYYYIEFFRGKSGQEILLTGNKQEIEILKNFLNEYFFKKFNLNKIRLRNLILLKKKISTLKKNIKVKKIKNFKKVFSFISKSLNKKNFTFEENFCHGDLTLSNIIVNSKTKKIILIDFLQSYDDNIMQDISKIYQEFVFMWSARNLKNTDSLRSKIVYEKILNFNFFKRLNNKLESSLKLEFLVTILRIIPYIKKNDDLTLEWIENSLKILNFMKILLLPVAGQSARYPGMRPKWLLTMPNGKLMIEQSVSKINCKIFDKIYIIALKDHLDKYVNSKNLLKSLKKNISNKVEIFSLNKETSCQAETILEFLKQKKIKSSFLIKDCDNEFAIDEKIYKKKDIQNSVYAIDIKSLELIDAKSKSYLEKDEYDLITNIVEKKIISDFFCCGAYGFR